MIHVQHSAKRKMVILIIFALGLHPGFAQEDIYNAYITFVDRYRETADGSAVFARTETLFSNTGRTNQVQKPPYALADLLNLLFLNDPAIKSAEQGILVALGNLDGAKAMRLPVLKLETSSTYIGNPPGPIVIKKGEFGFVDNPLAPGTSVYLPPQDVKVYDGMEHTLYQFKIIGDIPLWTWGKIGLGIDAGLINVQAAELAVKKIKHEKSIRLRGIVESLGYIQEIERILKLEQVIGVRLISLSEQNKKAGFITETEYLSIKINSKGIDIALIELNQKKQNLLAELGSMTGLKNLAMEDLVLSITRLEVLPVYDKTVLASAVNQNNYDLLLGSIYLEAKRKLLELARIHAKGFPDLGVHLEVSYSGPRFPFIETDWARKNDYQVTISIATQGNMLGNPQKKADAQKTKAELEEAEAKLAEGRARLGILVEQALSTIEMLKAQIEFSLLKQELYTKQLAQKKIIVSKGGGSEAEYLQDIIKALTALSEAYGYCIDYRTQLLTLDLLEGRGLITCELK